MNKTRVCLDCGEYWVDTGDDECPYCESHNTYVETEDEGRSVNDK